MWITPISFSDGNFPSARWLHSVNLIAYNVFSQRNQRKQLLVICVGHNLCGFQRKVKGQKTPETGGHSLVVFPLTCLMHSLKFPPKKNESRKHMTFEENLRYRKKISQNKKWSLSIQFNSACGRTADLQKSTSRFPVIPILTFCVLSRGVFSFCFY